MKIKIGLAQISVSHIKEDNLKKAEAAVALLASDGADIVVLPEMFSCPYITSVFPEFAEPEGGHTWQRMSEAAKNNKVILVAGSVPEECEGRIYNTSFVFSKDGIQIGKHRKAHLFDIAVKGGQHFRESDTLSPGDSHTVVDTELGKIGIAICYDFRFPELARKMTLEGARILIVPGAFNMTTGPAHWELLFRQRAVDNQVYCIGVAPARDCGGAYVSYANSIVTSPWGDIVDRLGESEQLLISEIDLDYEAAVREQLPLLRHRREELY